MSIRCLTPGRPQRRLHPKSPVATTRRRRRGTRRIARPRGAWVGWLYALPALAFYVFFNLRAVLASIQYSFYDWNGIGASTWVGLDNYREALTDSDQVLPLLHALILIVFFTALPVSFGLIAAATMRSIEGRFTGALARTVLFLPQIVPGAAAGVAWVWMYSENGAVNQILRLLGLGGYTRAWLGDFDFALIAVGFIGTWLSTGFCTLLLMSGVGRIDASLYEAARLDGATAVAQFRHITIRACGRRSGSASPSRSSPRWRASTSSTSRRRAGPEGVRTSRVSRCTTWRSTMVGSVPPVPWPSCSRCSSS